MLRIIYIRKRLKSKNKSLNNDPIRLNNKKKVKKVTVTHGMKNCIKNVFILFLRRTKSAW